MKFAITGSTLVGNMGAAAMVQTAMDELSARFPGAEFFLLSVSPDADRKIAKPDRLTIVSARPLDLMCFYFPLALICWPLRDSAFVRRLLNPIAYFRTLCAIDMVIDLCGIAFVDGRGLPLLAYNIACCLPAMVIGRPVAKMSQALGPFRRRLNRLAAAFILRRCRVLVARGAASFRHLLDLGVTGEQRPDVTFALTVESADRVRASEIIPSSEEPLLIACPSEVVNRLCRSHGIDFQAQFVELMMRRIAAGWRVAVVVHSFGLPGSKNNDLALCEAIVSQLPPDCVILVKADEDPRLLRAIVGRGTAFIGCRFHAVVAALAMGVPSLVIGWSHKYREMTEMLQPGDWFVDAAQFSATTAEKVFVQLLIQREELRNGILERLIEVRRQAASNFDLVAEALRHG